MLLWHNFNVKYKSAFYALVCPFANRTNGSWTLFYVISFSSMINQSKTVAPYNSSIPATKETIIIRSKCSWKKKQRRETIPAQKQTAMETISAPNTKLNDIMNKQKLGIDTLPFLWCVTVLILVLAVMRFKRFNVFRFWWWYFCQMGNGLFRYVAKIAERIIHQHQHQHIHTNGGLDAQCLSSIVHLIRPFEHTNILNGMRYLQRI